MLRRIQDHVVWLSHSRALAAAHGASGGTLAAIRSSRSIAWPISASTCGPSFGIVPV